MGQDSSSRRQLPTLSGLRAFEAAARFRSFKRAADELCVTESSISHQVRGLEKQMGVKLFERLHRRVVLTTEGLEYMIVVSKAFADIENCTSRFARNTSSAKTNRRRLIVSSEPGFAHQWLLPRIEAFSAVAPDVDLEIIPTLDPTRELSDRAILSIHYGWRITGAFHSEEIGKTHAFPVCSPTLLPRALDLSQAVLIHDRTLRMWGEWIEAAGMRGVDWRRGPIFSSSAMCMDAALNAHGIALGNEYTATRHLKSGSLVQPFELRIDPPGYRWFLVTELSARGSDDARTFRDWLIAELPALY